tara:strand:+ start:342 stop:791 length:450 start_codon:yes stop_codon:yes gene_type:complete
MDPITAVSATLATISGGIKAGKQLYAMKNEIVSFFDGVDQAKQKHSKKKNGLFASSNEEALSTFLDAQAARDSEFQLKEIIIGSRGFSAWTELQNIRKEVRQQRKAEEAQRLVDRQKRAEAFLTIAVVVLSAIALFGGVYALGFYLGWF